MSQDFFQAEFIKPAEMPSAGLFRDGRYLVVDLASHQFPDRCLKTDQPISGAHSLIKLQTYNVPADELDLIRGLVVASTNQLPKISESNKGNSVIVQLGVPLTPAQARRLKSPWPIISVIFFIALTIACFAGLFLAVDPNNALIFLSILVGVLIGIVGMIGSFVMLTLRTSRVLKIKRLADRKVWLGGVHADWLARLPAYAASLELIQRDHRRAASTEWWSFATALVFGIATLICGPIAFLGYTKGVASRTWPMAEGAIQNAEMKHHTSSRRGRRSEWWTVNFDFIYQANGQAFVGKGSERENSEWAAQNNLQRKPPGTPITVYYNPARPADNRLERGLKDSEIIWIVVSVIVCVIAVIAAIYGLMARARKAGIQLQLDEHERLRL